MLKQRMTSQPGCDVGQEPFDASLEMGCARGLYFGLVFVAPFWFALIAILVAM